MLINTLLILLRHGLPIVFAMVFFLLLNRQRQRRIIAMALLLAALLVVAQFYCYETLAAAFSQYGLELLQALVLLLLYLCCALLFIGTGNVNAQWHDARQWLWLLLLVLVLTLYAGDFFIYVVGVAHEAQSGQALLMGLVLGLGISASIGVLFYFALQHLWRVYHFNAAAFMLLLFGAGQLISVVNLLIQIDWLPSWPALWDSSAWLTENSEFGYFFTALLGYEATPSWLHLIGYGLALLLPGTFALAARSQRAAAGHGNLSENRL